MDAERTAPEIDSGPTGMDEDCVWMDAYTWHDAMTAWWKRSVTGRTKGDLRRSDVAWRKREKRLSAMRRQGRGGGR